MVCELRSHHGEVGDCVSVCETGVICPIGFVCVPPGVCEVWQCRTDEDCVEDGWICDVDPNAGAAFIHCQPPCQERGEPACPVEMVCEAESGGPMCVSY